jgi:predicted nucleic-acid-binding Zn-ribbon protein
VLVGNSIVEYALVILFVLGLLWRFVWIPWKETCCPRCGISHYRETAVDHVPPEIDVIPDPEGVGFRMRTCQRCGHRWYFSVSLVK